MLGKAFRSLWVAAVMALCAVPALATDDRGPARAMANGFDWFANAPKPLSQAEAAARTKAAIQKANGMAKGASWVCSPAGSGRKATCHKG